MKSNSASGHITAWVNPIKRALQKGKVCVGVAGLSFSCPATAQISAEAGYSFFYFDMEHSGLSIKEVEPICTAAKLAGIVPIGGSSGIADFLISRLLDNGAMGIIAPHVNTREETELLTSACLYAPQGTRGFINFGALTVFKETGAAEWAKAMNEEIFIAVKVESALGLDNIDEITEVPGLDAVMIGTGDLSVSLGIPGDFENPRLQQAVKRILTACQRNSVACGPHVSDPEVLKKWADQGATFMTCSFDGQLLLEASKNKVQVARRVLGERMFMFSN